MQRGWCATAGFTPSRTTSGERLTRVIQEEIEQSTSLVATLTGRRRPLTDRQLLRAVLRLPPMTLKVNAAIHYEALGLRLKDAPPQPRAGAPGHLTAAITLTTAELTTMLRGFFDLPDRNSRGPASRPSHLIRLGLRIAGRLRCGRLTIVLPDGARHEFRGADSGPSALLSLRRERAIRRFLSGGGAGFAEAYLDGDWDSPDLPRLLELLALNEGVYKEFYHGRSWHRWLARLQHLLRPNSRRGSRRNILAHYDLGNRFYELWLDRTMTYSAALFPHAEAPLEEAQRAKYRSLASRLRLQAGHRLLEIGCGWGGFAEFAAAEIGARVTAITISAQQHAFAAARIRAAGLADRVEVRLQDYRDVEGSYDRIAAIEMFEAVGERYWPLFFGKLRERLAPGGVAGLQVITIADRYFDAYRRSADFIQRHIFPGGMLPSPRVLREQVRTAGLAELGALTFGRDYACTLASWQQRFQAAWPQICQAGFDQRFKRLWEYYLAYCEAGFRTGCTDVCQLTLQRR